MRKYSTLFIFILSAISIILFSEQNNIERNLIYISILFIGFDIFLMIIGYLASAISYIYIKKFGINRTKLNSPDKVKYDSIFKVYNRFLSLRFFLSISFLFLLIFMQFYAVFNDFSKNTIIFAFIGTGIFFLQKTKVITFIKF